jgi:hypothetical protein
MMRLVALLTLWLAVPGLALAQTPQTETKSIPKPKAHVAQEEADTPSDRSESALERARAKQRRANGEMGGAEAIEQDEAASGLDLDPDTPRIPLAARLFVTHDPAAFRKAWQEGQDELPTAANIAPANPIAALVAVSGCEVGKDGKCAIEFTSRTAGPDGLFDKPNVSPPWKAAPMHSKPELAPAAFGLRLGPGDPPGRYTIEVTVNDLIGKTRRVLTATVTKPKPAEGR